MNSFRAVYHALEFEVERQTGITWTRGANPSGDARLVGRGRRDTLPALQGIRAGLPLFPGAGPTASCRRPGMG